MMIAKPFVQETLSILKSENRPLKLHSTLCVVFEKHSDTTIKDESYFSVKVTIIDNYDFDYVTHSIEEQIQNYNERGSDWIISNTKFFELNTSVYK